MLGLLVLGMFIAVTLAIALARQSGVKKYFSLFERTAIAAATAFREGRNDDGERLWQSALYVREQLKMYANEHLRCDHRERVLSDFDYLVHLAAEKIPSWVKRPQWLS